MKFATFKSNMSKVSIIIRILLAICFFFFGILFYGKFISLYLIDKPGLTYQAFTPAGQFEHILIFSLCLGAIPVVSIFLKLEKLKSILISAIIMSGLLAAGILLKRFLLTLQVNKYYPDELNKNLGIDYHLPLEKALPELYMVIGLIIGFVCYFY